MLKIEPDSKKGNVLNTCSSVKVYELNTVEDPSLNKHFQKRVILHQQKKWLKECSFQIFILKSEKFVVTKLFE